MNNLVKYPMAKILVIVSDSDKTEKIDAFLNEEKFILHYQFRAQGTANSEMMNLLGLGSIDKVVNICLATESVIIKYLNIIKQKLYQLGPGKGIAFTMPLSGIGAPILKFFNNGCIEQTKNLESEVERMKIDQTHDLVIAVVNQGYSEELMNAARAVGATGGTIIHARRVGDESSINFFGICMQEEKEIVTILVPHNNKIEMMKSITHACGAHTHAQGIIFALPVDGVAGIMEIEPTNI